MMQIPQQPMMNRAHENPSYMPFPMMHGGPLINPSLTSNENCLYVGNLHPEMNEISLYSEFSTFGNILNARLMKNTYTSESRRFGFVTFERKEQAEKAQKAMNNKEVFKREIRVYFKKNMGSLNPKANMVVKNLQKDVTSKQLTEECSSYGEPVSCFVKTDEQNGDVISLGYGYVQFSNEEDANNFFENFNGKNVNGQEVKVERFVPYKDRKRPESSNLYIKNFNSDLKTKEDVEKYIDEEFGKHGEINSKGVFEDKRLNKFYAFVAFKEVDDAKATVEALNGTKKEGSDDEPLYVSIAQSKRVRKKMLQDQKLKQKNETNMYIRSLKSDVTEEDMERVFSKYGKILSFCLKQWNRPARRMDEPQQQPQGDLPQLKFGFVNYERAEDAMKLFTSYKNDQDIRQIVQVENENTSFVFYAQPKKLRAQYLRMHKRNMMSFNIMKMMKRGGPGGHRGGFRGGRFPQMPNPNMFMKGPMVNSIQGLQDNHILKSKPEDLKSVLERITPSESAQVIKNRLKEFENLDEETKKNLLGHIMYQRVKSANPSDDLIPKITGMLIDLEVLNIEEILEIIENDESLKERIDEAIDVLENNDEDEDDEDED